MKKYVFLFLLMLLPYLAKAVTINGINYSLDKTDNSATVIISGRSGSLTIPSTVTYDGITYSVVSIGTSAFSGCNLLTSVTIPNSVTSIGDYAFKGCSSLTSVTIPNSVTSIGSSAFENCSGLTSVTIPNSVTSIGSKAFYNTPFFKNIADGVIYLGKCLYQYKGTMPKKTKIVIEDGMISISPDAFLDCSDLTSVTIPNSLTSIGSSAFSGCSGLTSVTIPNSVTSIDTKAFYNCTGLTSVTIPNSVTSIGYWALGGTPFYNNMADGVIYLGKCLYQYKGTMSSNTEIVIVDGTISISSRAFKSCSGLTSVIIPNSVTSIGEEAFRDCSGLTSVTIPNSVTSIGINAFRDCSSLTSVHISDLAAWCNISFSSSYSNPLYYTHHFYLNGTEVTNLVIPNSVTSISKYAFYGFSGLTSVTIPNSVTSIGPSAFLQCSGLTKVKVEMSSPLSIDSYTFSNSANATLYVPKRSKSTYSSADYWKTFKTIKEFPSTDVNGDNTTNVVDVVDIARFVVGTPATTFEEFLADLDGSREVNVADAIVLVNEIAGDTNWAKPSMAPRITDDMLSLTGDGSRLSFQMEGNGQYAAFQCDLWLPEGMDVMDVQLNDSRRQGHQLLYNKVGEGHYRVVALSTAANSFSGTGGELLGLTLDGFATDDIRMDNIHFVTTRGDDIPFDDLGVSNGSMPTTIASPTVEQQGPAIFNLNGQRIAAPQKGVNIVNGKKVTIK